MVENNFYKAIKPATIICKILGIFPFSYINDKVVLFRYTLVYNVLLLVLNIWLGFEISTLVLKQNVVEVITDMTLMAVNQLQFIVTLLKAIVSKDSWLDLAYAMQRTDKLFNDMGIQLPDKQLKRTMYNSFIAIVCFLVLGLGVQELLLNTLETYTEYIYWYTWIIFNSILNCCTAMYILRIRDGFRAVNSVLKEMVAAESGGAFNVRLKHLLSSACIAHQCLTKLMRKFNGCFGIILLATITASFLMIITTSYESYKAIKHQNVFVIAATMVFCFLYIINNVCMCHLCEVTVDEGRRSAALIHQIRSSDYEVKDEIEMFSLQIAHELHDFTAANVFPINHSLLFSMASGVSTLLIIIIQLSPK